MNTNTTRLNGVSPLLDISLQDLLKKLPNELIDSLVKFESMQRKRNIYLIEIDEASEEHVLIAKYQNITLEELPMEIIKENPIKGLFSFILNRYKDTLDDHQNIATDTETNKVEKLYFQILTNPQQILVDMQEYIQPDDFNKYHYYYCYDDDSWLKNLIKRGKLIGYLKD